MVGSGVTAICAFWLTSYEAEMTWGQNWVVTSPMQRLIEQAPIVARVGTLPSSFQVMVEGAVAANVVLATGSVT